MALDPGGVVAGETVTVTLDAGETISPGDAVDMKSDGTLRAANSGDTSNPLGVAASRSGSDTGTDYSSGEEVTVHVSGGVVLASAADAVAAGEELGASSTDGELAAGSGGIDALTDEGAAAGLSTNETIPAGYAGVVL